jgi:hypothetical protein
MQNEEADYRKWFLSLCIAQRDRDRAFLEAHRGFRSLDIPIKCSGSTLPICSATNLFR